jgi:hypothetical protein
LVGEVVVGGNKEVDVEETGTASGFDVVEMTIEDALDDDRKEVELEASSGAGSDRAFTQSDLHTIKFPQSVVTEGSFLIIITCKIVRVLWKIYPATETLEVDGIITENSRAWRGGAIVYPPGAILGSILIKAQCW